MKHEPQLFHLAQHRAAGFDLGQPESQHASRRDLIDELAALLTADGLEVIVTDQIAELESLANDATHELRAVVAAGGDGTIGLIANRTPLGTPIAILPLGTENLLSKYLDLVADPALLAAKIRGGITVQLDAGEANGRLFLLMTGVGFDADVVRRMHEQRQGNIHHLSYLKPIVQSIRNYQYPELRLYCRDAAGAQQELAARWAFVVNVPRYAGGLEISPAAVFDDGLLDVCTFKEGSLLSGLIYLSGIMFGQHTSWDDCVSLRATEIRITSDTEVPYQLDGDPGGVLPVTIRVLPRRLTCLVTDAWATKRGFAGGSLSST